MGAKVKAFFTHSTPALHAHKKQTTSNRRDLSLTSVKVGLICNLLMNPGYVKGHGLLINVFAFMRKISQFQTFRWKLVSALKQIRDSSSFLHSSLYACVAYMPCEVEVSFALLYRDSVSNYSLAAADRLQLETTVKRVSAAHLCLDWREHKAHSRLSLSPGIGSTLLLSHWASEGSCVQKLNCHDKLSSTGISQELFGLF